MSKKEYITLKLVRSTIGCLPSHRATAIGLGLKKLHKTVRIEDTPCTRGMINKISYLLEVESK